MPNLPQASDRQATEPNPFCTNRSDAGDACGSCPGCRAECERIRAHLSDWDRFRLADYDKQCRRTEYAESERDELRQLVKDMVRSMLGEHSTAVLGNGYLNHPDSWQHRAHRVLADLRPVARS